MSAAPANKPAIDIEFIKPFIGATKVVLEMMAKTTPAFGKAYLLKPSENVVADIVGVIDVESAAFRGTIAICFRTSVFLTIYERLVGERHTAISDEIADGAGELVNMIYGHAKTILNDQKGYKLPSKIPLILVGDRVGTHIRIKTPAVVLPFDSSAGLFFIEIIVDQV